jgi:hypothetical protein
MNDLSRNTVKELKELAKNANIPGRSKLTTKADLIDALNRLRVSRKSSSKSSKSSESSEKLIFRFKPYISSRGDHPDVLPHMTTLVGWYRGFAIEGAESEEATLEQIRHEGNKIIITLKLSSTNPLSIRNKIQLIKMIVDPDEDSNHPIKINRREYIVNGDNIEYKRDNEWISVEDD